MKKILLVSEFFYPHWTGYAKSFFKTALRLGERGYSCSVLATRHSKNLPYREICRDVRIYRANPLIKISRTQYSFSAIFKFIKLAKMNDLIIINCPHSNVLFFSLIAKLLNKKLVLFLNGDLILRKGLLNSVLMLVFDITAHASCILSDAVSTYTLDYARHSRILGRHLKKFHSLLLPVKAFEKEIDKDFDLRMKKLRKIKKAKHLVGFCGRFVREKGFDMLLKAVPKVIEKEKNVFFVFAGEHRMKYENFYEENRHLWNDEYLAKTGLVNKETEINAFYKNMDLMVMPSRSDCFPNLQAEAMEHKVPFVVTDIPGARFPVKNSGFGVIVKPEDADALSQGILYALANLKKIKNNHSKAMELFDENIFFRQFDSLVKGI